MPGIGAVISRSGLRASAVLGLAAGLLYDILRQIRAVSGKLGGILCDVFFCLSCTAALFLLGMTFCGGRLGVWEGAGFLAAFALYLGGISFFHKIAYVGGLVITAAFLALFLVKANQAKTGLKK